MRFSIGDCIAGETHSDDDKIIRVMSPIKSFSQPDEFQSEIERSLLRLIADKLQKSIRYEYLNSTTFHDVLQQIIHEELSEKFHWLVSNKRMCESIFF